MTQQSGLYAGKGGFDLTVRGNPNLSINANNPAAYESNLQNASAQITKPDNLSIWAPANDPVATVAGLYKNGQLMNSLKELPALINTGNSVHSSPGAGAVGSLSQDVNKPFSYGNLNLDQLNAARAAEAQANLKQASEQPQQTISPPQANPTTELQQLVQQQNTAQMNGLLPSGQVAGQNQPIRMSSNAYQKLMQLRTMLNEGVKL